MPENKTHISKIVWTMSALLAVTFLTYQGFQFGQALKGDMATETPVQPVPPQPAGDVALPPPPQGEINRIEDIDFTTYSTELASWVGLRAGDDKTSADTKIRAAFKPEKGAEGNAEYALTELAGEGATVMIAFADGLLDDSVKGQELYAIFKGDVLVTYGMKVKCWRGENSDQWQTETCN